MELLRVVRNKNLIIVFFILLFLSVLLFDNSFFMKAKEEETETVKSGFSDEIHEKYLGLLNDFYDARGGKAQSKAGDEFIKSIQDEYDSFFKLPEPDEDGNVEYPEIPLETWERIGLITLFLEQHTYVKDYSAGIIRIKDNADAMLTNPNFSKENSFTYRNIEKTVKDFKGLEQTEPDMINQYPVDKFLGHSIVDYLIIIVVFFVVLTFIDERKKGLWPLIYSTEKGRGALAFQRVLTLALLTLLCSAIFYGTAIIQSLIMYGGIENFTAPIQSIISFSRSTMKLSIIGYLLVYILFKAAALFLIGLCIWGVIAFFDRIMLGSIASIVFLAAQYLFYYFIWPQSSLNFLKYINLFSVLDVKKITQLYVNLKFFERPLALFTLEILVFCFILAIFLIVIFTVSINKKPFGKVYSPSAKIERLSGWASKKFSYSSKFMMEVYKVMVAQKGYLVLLGGLILLVYLPKSETVYFSESQTFLNSLYDKYEGEVTDEKVESIKALQNNGISNPSILLAFEKMNIQSEKLTEVRDETGIGVWFVNPKGYDYLFENGTDFLKMNSMYILIFLALLVCGIEVYDKEKNMTFYINSTESVRAVKRNKILLMIISAVILTFVFSVYEFVFILKSYQMQSFSAPVQSLLSFADFPFKISIRGLILAGYLLKGVVFAATGLLIMLVSSRCKSHKQSLILNQVVFVLPSALYIMGIEGVRYFTVVNYAMVFEWLEKIF